MYVFQSRILTHIFFWVGYYIFFSVIWAVPDRGYFASFYLEFVLMPVRILSVYFMLYWLIPQYLVVKKYFVFALGYIGLIAVAGLLQMLISHFFYNQLMPELTKGLTLSLTGWGRSAMLVNTTVILIGSLKVFQLFVQLQEQYQREIAHKSSSSEYIEVKADRKIHRLKTEDILYLEGMGNYVTYHLAYNQKRIVYISLKQALTSLPGYFFRVHRSYVVNKHKIDSYNNDEIFIGEHALPRGKDVEDRDLIPT